MEVRELEDRYTVPELKEVLRQHSLDPTGNKRSLCLRLVRAGVRPGKVLRWSGAGKPGEKLLKSGGSTEKIREMAREGYSWSDVSDWITRQIGYDRDVLSWARDIFNEARKVTQPPGSIYMFTEPISDRDKDLAEIAVRLQSTEQWDAIAERLGALYPDIGITSDLPGYPVRRGVGTPTKWEKEVLFYLMVGYKLKPGMSLREIPSE